MKSLKARVAKSLFEAFERGTWQPRNLRELLEVIWAIEEGVQEELRTYAPAGAPAGRAKPWDN